MGIEQAVIFLLQEVFPKSLVGLEVIPGMLPPLLKSKRALKYIEKLVKDPRIDHDAVLDLKNSAALVRHTPSAQGCTVTYQELEAIQHKLAEAPDDATFTKLELTRNEIMHYVLKQIEQTGYFPQNLDTLKKELATKSRAYKNTHTLQEIGATRYNRFKEHCIIKTSGMYNRGDKGDNNNTNFHANMVRNQVAAQMVALAEWNDDLEDNQLKLNDAFAQLTFGGVSIGGDGGIPPVIDTKLMGTAQTEDYLA